MSNSLLDRPIQKRPDKVRLQGRILFLTEDPELIRKQLSGWDLPWDTKNSANNPKLRDDISTDEITPAHYCFYFDQTLGEIPYLGLKCGAVHPIGRSDVKKGGFVCSVSGKRRGKGSSREQSPYAEMCAGIHLVIAENIERIYKQNCQNLGLLTSTNVSLIARIRAGEEIPLSEFTTGEDEITRQVIEHGGLFPFNVARLQKKVFLPPIATRKRPMTLAEKIFASHMVSVGTGLRPVQAERSSGTADIGVEAVKPGDTGFTSVDLRFSHEYVTPMAAIFYEQNVGKDVPVNDAASIRFFRDHLTFLDEVISEEKKKLGLLDLATQLKVKQADFAKQQGIKLHGELTDRKGSEGICHSVMLETYALPGQVNVGSDSHTPHVGAIGCIAFGIGTTDVFNSWITKDVRVKVPESVKIVIRGKKHPNVTAKDFILKILSLDYVRSGKALAKVMEYAGEAVEALSVDERATMTNMAAEIGGFTGIVAPDEKVVEFLMERRGMKRAEAEQMIEGLQSDPNAEYAQVIELDAAEITPMVATPGDPGNGKYIRELNTPVPVEIAYGGTCTAGKNEDMDMYAAVLADALKQGKRVAPNVNFWIQFGSQETRDYCKRKGYIEIFEKAGAHVIEPSCGACINAGPGVSTRPDQIVISAQNRNFPGRSGPGQMYLASPLTVAASAVAGYVVEYEPAEHKRDGRNAVDFSCLRCLHKDVQSRPMTATWGKRLFQSGAIVLVILGCVHTLAVLNTPVPANDTERQLFQLMNEYKRNLLGSLRSTSDLFLGFNISFVIFPIVLGVFDLAVSAERPGLLKRLALINVLGMAAMTANSLYNWFAAPTTFLAAACVLFAAAWMNLSAEPVSR